MGDAVGALATIDTVIIGTYMLGVLVVGAYFSRYIHSAGDYFLAGKALPFWAVGMSIVVSDIGAIDIIAGAGGTFKHGIAQANFDWIGSMPAALIAAIVFVPYYWRSGVYTIPEFLGRRYNSAVQIIQAFIWLTFLAAMLAMMLYTSAVLLEAVLGWNQSFSIWITVAFVGIYTVSGGLAAVVMTDVMQMVVMFVGTGSLLVIALWKTHQMGGLSQAVLAVGAETKDHFTLLLPHDAPTPYPWTGIVFGLGIVLSTAYFTGNQAIVQRVLGARSEWDAKAGMIFAGFLKLFIPLLVFIPGLAARALHPELVDADKAVPILIRELLPPGLLGLMFAAFLAALMSSVDSYLNSCSTVFISDVYGNAYRRLRGSDLPTWQGLWLGRLLTAVLLITAGLVAPVFGGVADNTLYEIIQTMMSLFQGPTLAILLLGILWSRTTGWGGLTGLVLGVCMTGALTILGGAVFPSDDPFLFISFWSFLFSLAVTVIVSLLTPREPDEKLRGLVYRFVVHDDDAQALLRDRVNGS